MELNYLGLVAALATFFSIWWGHVGVRKIEALSTRLWLPMFGAILLGIIFNVIAARAGDINLSAACGIIGMVFLWDGFEFYRQQNRVKKGHAPANPDNPRHERLLSEYPEATTFDWLNRNPRGKRYSVEELTAMKDGAE